METKIREIRRDVERRFLKDGIMIEYTDESGAVIRPTIDQCKRAMPNAFGWWTPIENGAFFSGLYLSGLLNGIGQNPPDEDKRTVLQIMDGLFRLQDVAGAEGFIARGVGEDGVSHYPYGSIDQTAPWVYGLWKLWKAKWLNEATREQIRVRVLRVLRALKRNDWFLPSEREERATGCFRDFNMREAARLLWFCRIGEQMDPSGDWHSEYLRLAYEQNEQGMTRVQACTLGSVAERAGNDGLCWQFWIYLCAQLCLQELCEAETDGQTKQAYRKGLDVSAQDALLFAPRLYAAYLTHPDKDKTFDLDWRKLEDLFYDEDKAFADVMGFALTQCGYWQGILSPRRKAEQETLLQAVFACWCAMATTNDEIARYAYRTLDRIVAETDFSALYLTTGAWAACAYYAFCARKRDVEMTA